MGYDLQEPCGSGDCNVITFQKLHDQAREGTSTWQKTKKPDLPEKAYGPAAGTALAGAVLCVAGGWMILAGLALMGASVGLGMRAREEVASAKRARQEWPKARICQHCDRTIAPRKGA
ncbi:hypothetical protein ACTWP5_27755 [Streptomyces sp. 4N509B]|uniref:hypothetical protein n=1 Tax=Streptomyces sp. 4N509B TaxID=3457413 RepID=UPI003FD1A6AC